MKQLSGMDNLFINQEKPGQCMHVASLGIYDPSTAPEGMVRFKTVLDFFTSKMSRWDLFRRRLIRPPFGIDRPYWVDGANVDVEYHVRHIGLPHPGDWRQLMIQVARIHSRPLDLKKPLWEAYIIEGLDNIEGIAPGSFALYIKFHHSAVDGELGAKIMGAIHTLEAEFDPATLHNNNPVITDRDPSVLELVSRAVEHRAKQMVDASKLVVSLAKVGGQFAPEALEFGEQYLSHLFNKNKSSSTPAKSNKIPKTRFSDHISPHRVVDAAPLSLEDCQIIRNNVENVTINDIFLASVGRCMQKYLAAKGEAPTLSMHAMMPISTRNPNAKADAGNQIGSAITDLCSNIEDPIEQLIAVSAAASRSKKTSQKMGSDIQAELLNVLPSALVEKAITFQIKSTANVTVSNVRGPNVPLFMAGAKMQMFMPISIPMDGLGLNVTGFSYNGVLWVAITCCRAMLPDPAFFTQCLNDAFAEIVEASTHHGETVKRKSPTAKLNKKPAKQAS
jgi:WS/DGAT/MGAT family acyltransferase